MTLRFPFLGLIALAACADEDARLSTLVGEVFEPNCTFACHSGGEFAAGGLDLEHDAYGVLVGVAATARDCKDTGLLRVARGVPERSLLYTKARAKLHGTDAPCGESMPEGEERASLSPEQVRAIREWIERGAPDD